MDDQYFRTLTPEEEADFRAWARDNWHPGDPVNPTWHPVVRHEIERIRDEAIRILRHGGTKGDS